MWVKSGCEGCQRARTFSLGPLLLRRWPDFRDVFLNIITPKSKVIWGTDFKYLVFLKCALLNARSSCLENNSRLFFSNLSQQWTFLLTPIHKSYVQRYIIWYYSIDRYLKKYYVSSYNWNPCQRYSIEPCKNANGYVIISHNDIVVIFCKTFLPLAVDPPTDVTIIERHEKCKGVQRVQTSWYVTMYFDSSIPNHLRIDVKHFVYPALYSPNLMAFWETKKLNPANVSLGFTKRSLNRYKFKVESKGNYEQ